MPTIVYIDCPTGISGDMLLAAFINAGLPEEFLTRELKKLEFDGYELKSGMRKKQGLTAGYFEVSWEHQHHHRSYQDIKSLIETSELSLPVKRKALSVFERLAVVEARAHGVKLEDVHFHEVGAVDSIVDIVGAALALDYFHVDTLVSSPLPMGGGWIKSAHGMIPLPAPATMLLLENIPVYGVPIHRELVTPTGAAIVSALAQRFGPWPKMIVKKIGFGAGTMDLPDRPNILRLAIGESRETEEISIGRLSETEQHIPEHHGHHEHHHAAHSENGVMDETATREDSKSPHVVRQIKHIHTGS